MSESVTITAPDAAPLPSKVTAVPTVVMYPDHLGHGLAPGGFADQLHTRGWAVCAVINGSAPEVSAPSPREGVQLVHSPVLGLAGSLPYGYAAASGEVVVRVDSDPEYLHLVGPLAEAAALHGAVVADPVFGAGTLRPGSVDEHSQLDVFPSMFNHFTSGRVKLSGTHGFQAWREDVLRQVLPLAVRVWNRAGNGATLLWGFDAAMVAAADILGWRVHVLRYPFATLRDRDRRKVAAQFDAVHAVLHTAYTVHPAWSE